MEQPLDARPLNATVSCTRDNCNRLSEAPSGSTHLDSCPYFFIIDQNPCNHYYLFLHLLSQCSTDNSSSTCWQDLLQLCLYPVCMEITDFFHKGIKTPSINLEKHLSWCLLLCIHISPLFFCFLLPECYLVYYMN